MLFLANIDVIKETIHLEVFIFTSTENDNPISLSHKFYRVDIENVRCHENVYMSYNLFYD